VKWYSVFPSQFLAWRMSPVYRLGVILNKLAALLLAPSEFHIWYSYALLRGVRRCSRRHLLSICKGQRFQRNLAAYGVALLYSYPYGV
jgi:hypothetical protein